MFQETLNFFMTYDFLGISLANWAFAILLATISFVLARTVIGFSLKSFEKYQPYRMPPLVI